MRTFTKIGIGIIAVIVPLSCAWMYHTHSLYEKTYRSEYRYEVAVRMDSSLYNAIFYVPMPVSEGGSKMVCEIIAENASKPEEWDCDLIETEHGKMLKIHAEEMIPDLHAPPVPLPEEECGPDAIPCPVRHIQSNGFRQGYRRIAR